MNKKDEKEYDEYIVKVARYDKDGNDISGDKLGGGGRHRDDGTISAMAYDFQPLEDAEFFEREEKERLLHAAYESEIAEHRESEAKAETTQAALKLADDIIVFLTEHPEIVITIGKGIKKGVIFVKNKIASTIATIKDKKGTAIATKQKNNQVVYDQKEDDTPGQEMTLEEAQSEYIELFKDYLRMKGRAQKLAKAHIVDADVKVIDANHFIELMNSLSKKFPALLDEGVQITVFEMLDSMNSEKEKKAILAELNIKQ